MGATVSDKTWHNTNAARYEIRVDTGGSFHLRGCCNSAQCPGLNSNGFKKGRCKQLRQIWQENPESSDDFLSNLLEAVTTRNRRAPESSYIRFGKRAPESSYIRFGKRARSLDLDALQDCLNEQRPRADYFRTIRPTYTDAVRICQEE